MEIHDTANGQKTSEKNGNGVNSDVRKENTEYNYNKKENTSSNKEKIKEKIKLCVLFGSASSEYEVSLSSAFGVLENTDRELFDVYPVGITKDGRWYLYFGDTSKIKDGSWTGDKANLYPLLFDMAPSAKNFIYEKNGEKRSFKPDAVFPVLHGKVGEGGEIQGMLEICKIPFVGADHTSSGVCMDKALTKIIVGATGIKQAAYCAVERRDFACDRLSVREKVKGLGYPVFVKPARSGSSVGVSKVKCEDGLFAALEKAFEEDSKVVVEEYIDGRETEVAVLESGGRYTVSIPGEIDPGFEFYDYETKYIKDGASFYIPARLDENTTNEVRRAALEVFKAAGCRGLSRVDFFVTRDGRVIFNEINTIPGFTPISMYPKLFEASGISYKELISELVRSALEKE